MTASGPRPTVFVSSLFEDDILEMRQQLKTVAEDCGVNLYLAEDDLPRPVWEAFADDLERVDRLIAQVATADSVLVLVGPERHGQSLSVQQLKAKVSYFEVELFQSVLRRKPLRLVLLSPYKPQPELDELLRLAGSALPRDCIVGPAPLDEVPRLASAFFRETRERPRWSWRRTLKRLVVGFGRSRSSPLFLDGFSGTQTAPPDLNLAESVLLEPSTGTINAERQLARTWIAIRELISWPLDRILKQTRAADLLDQALSIWAKNASYYDVHGYLAVSDLAATNSLTLARKVAYNQGRRTSHDVPHGTYASLYYSLAKLYPAFSRAYRTTLKNRALHHINEAISVPGQNPGNHFGTRGAIYLALRQIDPAVRDFERSLQLRLDSGASKSSIGHVMSYLGFVYGLQGRAIEGAQLIEDGTQMLREDGDGHPGFLVRALRKQALLCELCGSAHASDLRNEAIQIAQKHGLEDQLRQIRDERSRVRRLQLQGLSWRARISRWLRSS